MFSEARDFSIEKGPGEKKLETKTLHISEEEIENIIETHHSIENIGTKGLIIKILKEELPKEIQEEMGIWDNEQDEGESASLAVKALKIFNHEDARHEYEAQLEARNIVQQARSEKPLAKVPRVGSFHEITVNKKTQDFLNKNGTYIADGKVGLIVMDFIEGMDLATLLYREALKRNTSEERDYSDEYIDSLPFDQLRWEVSTMLNFSKPGGKSRNEGERIFEEETVKAGNAKALFHWLSTHGFVLPQKLLDQIKNTVELFHKNELFNNDLHERNVIVQNGDLEHPQAYIIDYGSATRGKRAPGDETSKPIADEAIVNRLAPLTKSPETKFKERFSDTEREWESIAESAKENPKAKKQYEAMRAAIEVNNDNVLEQQFASASFNDSEFQIFLGNLLKMYREKKMSRSHIEAFLTAKANEKKMRPFNLRQIQDVRRMMGNQGKI
ncbi:MAG: hypothetical protein ABR884_02710 [Minisyncoccia bacterium]|jgi:hypothetical protein